MLSLYMDEHVDGAITRGLRRRGIDVLRVQDDGYMSTDDSLILDHAAAIGRVVFTRDKDFLAIACSRQLNGVPFAGVIFAHQDGPTIGQCVTQLELMATVYEHHEFADRVEYLTAPRSP